MNLKLGQKFWMAYLAEDHEIVKLACGHTKEKTVPTQYKIDECQIVGRYEVLDNITRYDILPFQWCWVLNDYFKNDQKAAMRFFDKKECQKFVTQQNKKLK